MKILHAIPIQTIFLCQTNKSIILLDIQFKFIGKPSIGLNPAKRNVMVVKNEMRLLKQKRNVLQI